MMTRFSKHKSDYDVRLGKTDRAVSSINTCQDQFGLNFEVIAKSLVMLIENVNMQMESEIVDLMDRQNISLYAGHSAKITENKEERQAFGHRHRSEFTTPGRCIEHDVNKESKA
jgi:hypothetical protein